MQQTSSPLSLLPRIDQDPVIGTAHHAVSPISNDALLAFDVRSLLQVLASILMAINNTLLMEARWVAPLLTALTVLTTALLVTVATVDEATDPSLSEQVIGDVVPKDALTTTLQRMSTAFDAVLLAQVRL